MSEAKKNSDIHNRQVRHRVVTESGIRFAEIELGGEERDLPLPPRRDLFDPPQGSESAHSDMGAGPIVKPEALLDLDWDESFRYISREQQFVQKARELAWHVEEAADFTPFKSYWPTYDQMTRDQSRWYFYWREEVRSGCYPDTDLSYLFVYIYELIHGVGWSDPMQGYELLSHVWEAYRVRYPKLDTYLREWLYDFMIVHGLDMPVKEIQQRPPRNLSGELKELEWLRRLSADPVELNWDFLMDLIDYDIEKSRFYREGGRKDLQRLTPKVIALADSYSARYQGGRLMERFRPRPRQVTRHLFRSAVYDHGLYGRTVSVTVLPLSEHAPLRSCVTGLVRLTENKLRELRGFKGRLRGIDVPQGLEDLVSRFLKRELEQQAEAGRKTSAPAVKIDTRKLRRLQRESDEVRDMLLTDPAHAGTNAEAPSSDPALEVEKASGKSQGQKIVPVKRDSGGEPLLFQTVMDFDATPPGSAAAGSDEKAPAPSRQEEAPSTTAAPVSFTEHAADAIVWDTSALDEEWQELAERLEPVHLQMLFAIKNGPDLKAMQQAADLAGSMPELLLDQINDAAMDTIGDLLLDGDVLADEYIEVFDTLLRMS